MLSPPCPFHEPHTYVDGNTKNSSKSVGFVHGFQTDCHSDNSSRLNFKFADAQVCILTSPGITESYTYITTPDEPSSNQLMGNLWDHLDLRYNYNNFFHVAQNSTEQQHHEIVPSHPLWLHRFIASNCHHFSSALAAKETDEKTTSSSCPDHTIPGRAKCCAK